MDDGLLVVALNEETGGAERVMDRSGLSMGKVRISQERPSEGGAK